MLHDTYTYKEIRQQPTVWSKTKQQVEALKEDFQQFVDKVNDFAQGRLVKVLFTGAGSSAYVGDMLRLSKINQNGFNWEFENVSTTHFVTDPASFIEQDKVYVVVSFARSGNSPETKGTVNLANELTDNIFHIFITNNKDGFLSQYDTDKDNVFKIVLPDETNDKSLAMTSSFSTMVLAGYLLFGGEVSQSFIDTVEQNFDAIEQAADKVAEQDHSKIFYVGTGVIGELTREVSLKLNELTGGKIEIARETTLGFRHGPKAGLNEGSLFIMLRSNDAYQRQYEQDLIKEVDVEGKNYDIVVLDSDNDEADHAITFNNTSQFNSFELALMYLVFGQLLASKKSVGLGLNPDTPSPDGFINRVVKGVTIYDYK